MLKGLIQSRNTKEEEKKKGYEKTFEEIMVETFPIYGKGNSKTSPRVTKSPKQDQPKEKHSKTHTNQTSKD